ncbi:MAG TPA: pentapeptide repeat-containing protein [Mycobacteriales bacterium]|jgi:uncharacterized protein YjbI with pentapeptide repeats
MTERAIPWPGPVPLRQGQRQLLFGRDADIERVLVALRTHSVVELVAPTSAGKTSLLYAGVVDELARINLVPVVCRDWNSARGSEGAEFYCQVVDAMLPRDVFDVPALESFDSPIEFLEAVDAATEWPPGERRPYQSRLILIFDQVEELLRYDKRVGLGFLRVVAHAAQKFRFGQVVSLRREFHTDLRQLEQSLVRDLAFVEIEPIATAAVRDLITKPLASSWLGIDDDAVRLIEEWWAEATQDDAATPESSPRGHGDNVGLLHLQSLLWSLADECREVDSATVTRQAVEAFGAGSHDMLDGGPASFARALQHYVATRMAEAAIAHPDPRQATTVEYAAALVAPHLSSAGYKLLRDAGDLLWQSLDDAFRELSLSEGEAMELLADPAERARAGGERTAPDEQDPRTAGRARGWTARAAGAELVVCFDLALSWLRDVGIVSDMPTVDGTRVVTLVHDGFGKALEKWSRDVITKPANAIESLTVLRGRELRWSDFARSAVVSDVRWRGCVVTADLDGVTFRNADLAGALFLGCHLTDVHFQNCDLRGAVIVKATVAGADGVTIEGGIAEGLGIQAAYGAAPLRITSLVSKGLFLESLDLDCVTVTGSAIRHAVVSGGDRSGVGSVEIVGSVLSQCYFGDRVDRISARNSAVLFTDSVPRDATTLSLDACAVVASTLGAADMDEADDVWSLDGEPWRTGVLESLDVRRFAT